MNNVRKVLFVFAFALCCYAGTANGQVIVTVRPERPHYERIVSPGPRHVWIEEEWEPRGRGYAFNGGRWALPPRPGVIWIPGHWAQRPRGWVWMRGHWRR